MVANVPGMDVVLAAALVLDALADNLVRRKTKKLCEKGGGDARLSVCCVDHVSNSDLFVLSNAYLGLRRPRPHDKEALAILGQPYLGRIDRDTGDLVADALEFTDNSLQYLSAADGLNVAHVLQQKIGGLTLATDAEDLKDEIPAISIIESLLVAGGTEGLTGKSGTQEVEAGEVRHGANITERVGFSKVQVVGLDGILLQVDRLDALKGVLGVSGLEGLEPVTESADA